MKIAELPPTAGRNDGDRERGRLSRHERFPRRGPSAAQRPTSNRRPIRWRRRSPTSGIPILATESEVKETAKPAKPFRSRQRRRIGPRRNRRAASGVDFAQYLGADRRAPDGRRRDVVLSATAVGRFAVQSHYGPRRRRIDRFDLDGRRRHSEFSWTVFPTTPARAKSAATSGKSNSMRRKRSISGGGKPLAARTGVFGSPRLCFQRSRKMHRQASSGHRSLLLRIQCVRPARAIASNWPAATCNRFKQEIKAHADEQLPPIQARLDRADGLKTDRTAAGRSHVPRRHRTLFRQILGRPRRPAREDGIGVDGEN